MAGSTPIYGIPYPESSDLVANYPALGEDLAETLETVLLTKLTTPGAWSGWSLAISGTGWSLGNGTLASAYSQVGNIVFFRCGLIIGSTTSIGSGTLSFNLPVNKNEYDFQSNASFNSYIYDASLAHFYIGGSEWNSLSSAAPTINLPTELYRSIPISSAVTSPITFASGDQIYLRGFYSA